MNKALRLTVLTPFKVLLDAPLVTKVRLRLADGNWLSIYPQHLPLIAEVPAGPVEYVTVGGKGVIALAPGILRVTRDHVSIFTSALLEDEETGEAVDVGGDEAISHFDRLARELFLTLDAHPADAVES